MRLAKLIKACWESSPKDMINLLVRKLSGKQLPSPVAKVWTDYMSWLIFANAGMLARGNVHCFDYVIKNLPSNAPIIEIGSFCGLSTNMITYCKQRHGVKNILITCDKWIFEGAEKGEMLEEMMGITYKEYREFIKDAFVRNVSLFSRRDLPYPIEMLSDEFFLAWANKIKIKDTFNRDITLGGKISFCYIDGNHSYPYVKRDFENCDKYLELGGFILFDDSENNNFETFKFEVHKVIKEVIKTGRYELVINNPNHLFKKMKD